jgi:hypothetical protein
MSSVNLKNNRKAKMQTEKIKRLRLNSDLRNKIASRFKVHLEAEDTQEKEKFFELRENFKDLQDKTWKLAEQCVRKAYPQEDVDTCFYLQNKYPNVDNTAKDSCFHFGYMGRPEEKDEDDKYISKHFDFRLGGDIDGIDRQSNQDEDDNWGRKDHRDFAYAYFRDELKAKDGCNPDINIEQHGKENNPHKTKYQDNNDRALGFNSGRHNLTSYSDKWDKEYELDLIGREYCRDRQIAIKKEEFQTFLIWQQSKGQLIIAHHKWIDSILKQMKFVKDVIKGYKYLDEAIEFAKESDLNINDAEIIRTNSTGLAIYNPVNAAQMLKSMKNKNVSREDKIAFRKVYEAQNKIN